MNEKEIDMPVDDEDTLARRCDAAMHTAHIAVNDALCASNGITDPHYLAGLLADLRDLKAEIAMAYSEIEAALLLVAGDKKLEVPNLGVVEIKRKTKRTKWDHDELFKHVIARIVDDRSVFWDAEDGSFLPPAVQAANIVGRLREVLSPSWKVTGVRGLGLQVDEFCQEEPDGYSVQLPPRSAA